MKTSFSVLSLLLLCSHLTAQTTIEEQVVTASSYPLTLNNLATVIDVITAADIAAIGGDSVLDILATNASIQTFDLNSSGSRGQVSMRGFAETGANNIVIAIDGVKLNNPSLEAPLLSHIALSDVERIEILRGSGSVLFGDQAGAGVINIITKNSRERKIQAILRLGSYRHNDLWWQMTLPLDKNWSYNFQYEQSKNDNYRFNNRSEFYTDSHSFDWQYSDWGGSVQKRNITDKLQLPGALYSLHDRRISHSEDDYSTNHSDHDNIKLHFKIATPLQLRVTNNYRATDRYGKLSDASFITAIAHSDSNLLLVYNSLLSQWQINSSFGVQQLQASSESVYTAETYTYSSYAKQRHQSWYFQNFASRELWSLSFGVRNTLAKDLDRLGTTVNRWDLTAAESAVKYQFSPRVQLSLRLTKSFRIANADEFSLAPVNGLQPQSSLGLDLTFKIDGDHSSWQYNIYTIDLKNEIVYDPMAGNFGLNINLPSSKRLGWQLDYNLQQKGFWWDISIASIDATFSSGNFKDKKVPFVANYNLTTALNHNWYSKWQGRIEWFFIGERFAAGDYGNIAPKVASHAVLNYNLRYQLNDNTLIALRLNNLLAERYQAYQGYALDSYYYPAKERNWNITLTVNF